MNTTTQPTPADATTDAATLLEAGHEEAIAFLQSTLGADGWRVVRTRKGVKARSRWFSVGIKFDAKTGMWRARLRDGVPRMTATPTEALAPVAKYALDCARFCDGRLGLFNNPSKSYLGHRLWQAVRPVESPAE